jgi:hypothetical protein
MMRAISAIAPRGRPAGKRRDRKKDGEAMLRKSLWAMAASLFVLNAAGASEPAHDDKMMAEMMKCSVCKVMAPHMATLAPVMKHEIFAMDNGVAIRTWLTDTSKVGTYHSLCDKMKAAGEASASYTPEQVSKELCSFCQGIHGLMASGATMSHGKSESGDLMVISSEKPEVQKQIAAFQTKAEEMMGS